MKLGFSAPLIYTYYKGTPNIEDFPITLLICEKANIYNVNGSWMFIITHNPLTV